MSKILSLPGYDCLESYTENPKQSIMDKIVGYKPQSSFLGINLGIMSKDKFLASMMFKKIPQTCIRCNDTGRVILPV